MDQVYSDVASVDELVRALSIGGPIPIVEELALDPADYNDTYDVLILLPVASGAVWNGYTHTIRARWIADLCAAIGYTKVDYTNDSYFIETQDDSCMSAYNGNQSYCAYTHEVSLNTLVRWAISSLNLQKLPRIVEHERIEIVEQKGYITSLEKYDALSVALSKEIHHVGKQLENAYLNNNHTEAQRLLAHANALREVMEDLDIEERSDRETVMFLPAPNDGGLWSNVLL